MASTPPARLTLSPDEAANAVGVSPTTLRMWMREEGLPYYRIKGRVLILVEELKSWIRTHKDAPENTLRERVDSIIRQVSVLKQ